MINCEKFESYISEYIDGELKLGYRKDFINHKSKCTKCSIKLEEMFSILDLMPNIYKIKTSNDFLPKLNKKINTYDNKIDLKKTHVLGFNYSSIFGLAASLILIFTGTYLFVNQDSIPIVNLEEYDKSKISIVKDTPNLAEEDSLVNSQEKYDLPIRLVGGNK